VKKLRILLVQSALVLVITLVLAEVVLRAYNHFSPSFIFYSGSYERFRGKPHSQDWDFRLNAKGFKDVEFEAKAQDEFRILGLGDSFTYGVVPYRNNYLTLLQGQWEGTGRNVNVLNMGIPSTSPREYLALLVGEGLDLDPDMVLVSFFIGNDFFETKEKSLLEHSYVASLMRYLVQIRAKVNPKVRHQGAYCDDCFVFDEERYLKMEFARSSIYRKHLKILDEKLLEVLHYLGEMKALCDREGLALSIAIIPDEMQVDPALWQQVRNTYYAGVDDKQFDLSRPNRLLKQGLDQLGIDYLDLTPAFMEDGRRLYRPRDSHWNIAGNELAARLIGNHLRSRYPGPLAP
jgi:hypothetical protein